MLLTWTNADTWIVVLGVLCAVSCALLGNFLLLRRMSMMGDAISHAVLPGLAIAFMWTGTRASVPMFVGAAIVGVLTAVLTQWLHTIGRVDRGAAMGVVFTSLFAIGLILIVRTADDVDLDADCVLYGSLEFAAYDRATYLGMSMPPGLPVLLTIAAVNLLVVSVLFKEFRIAAFDPSLARTLGFSPRFLHYLLMILVAVTTVASFEYMGSILVIAMLIVPAAIAHLLTDRLRPMLIVSMVIAALGVVVGHSIVIALSGIDVNIPTGGTVVVTFGLGLGIALIAAPRRGLIARIRHARALRIRIAGEDLLAVAFRAHERREDAWSLSDAAKATGHSMRDAKTAATRLRDALLLTEHAPHTIALTSLGQNVAHGLVRAHRLWERYLHDVMGLAEDHVHHTAHQMEHVTSPPMVDALDDAVGAPDVDPHGRQIPGIAAVVADTATATATVTRPVDDDADASGQ